MQFVMEKTSLGLVSVPCQSMLHIHTARPECDIGQIISVER